MEQIKQYWENIKTKMDEDPMIKKAVIGAGVAIAAIILMIGLKAFKSQAETPSLIEQVETTQNSTVTTPSVQPATVAQQPAATVVAATSQQVVSSAIKPLSALSTMVTGYTMSYSYAGGGRVDDQSLFAKVAEINRDTPTFQFLVKPDESLNQQIIPGDVVIQTKAVGYFAVEQQSAPLLNVLITSSGEERNVQVYIDDQVIPLIDNKDSGYGISQVSLPIVQMYAAGLHRITVVTTANYSKRDLKTSVRMSIKRDSDPAPVDLQVYREAPLNVPSPAVVPPVNPITTTGSPVQTSAPVVKGGV